MTKDWYRILYLVFKRHPYIPGERLNIYIGYKYNYRKVLIFLAIEEVGTNPHGVTYYRKFPGRFSIFSINYVPLPLGGPTEHFFAPKI